MSVTIEVSEAVHEVLEAHRRENESLEETIKRLLGGPHPETLAQVVGTDAEDADVMRAAIERERTGLGDIADAFGSGMSEPFDALEGRVISTEGTTQSITRTKRPEDRRICATAGSGPLTSSPPDRRARGHETSPRNQ